MLRAVAFENFIHFRDRQSLKFQKGSNFIVGPNGSGKSAIFELIRRCLPNNVNISTSNVAEKGKPAFVISKFKITEKLSDKLTTGCSVYACLYKKEPEKKYKVVCIKKKGQQDEIYIDFYEYKHGDEECRCRWKKPADPPDNVIEAIPEKNKKVEQSVLDVFRKLIKTDESLDSLDVAIETAKSKINVDEMVEQILKDIHDAVVFTFPIRSPGPIQWSHSKNMGRDSEHYNTTSDKAEILQTLLGSLDKEEEENANSTFDMLISPLKYTFKRNGPRIIVEDGEREIPLLKVPVGIIEAMQFSLMFAHKKYQTLMLEEPDRGMHPHMIQKLRDLVLRTEQERVLVLTTHQTSMINVWSMSRLFVCSKTKSQDQWKHQVSKMSDEEENIHQVEDILKEMVFSEAVLFVEGVTDKKVIRSIFDRILEEESLAEFKEQHDKLKRIVAKTLILPCNGIPPYKILKSKAEKLNLQYAFLIDRDLSFECKAKIMPEEVSTLNAKWKRSVLHCINAVLNQNKHETSKKENSQNEHETSEMKNFQSVENVLLKTKTERGQTILKELDLTDNDLKKFKIQTVEKKFKIQTVEKIMEEVLLPVQFTPKTKMFGEEGVGDKEEIKGKSIENKEENKESIKKCVFHWESGDLEDMICRSILKTVKPPKPPTYPPSDEEQRSSDSEKLFGFLFKVECQKDKNPIKENLMQMNFSESLSLRDGMPKTFSEMLLKSDDMESFLNFLLSNAKTD